MRIRNIAEILKQYSLTTHSQVLDNIIPTLLIWIKNKIKIKINRISTYKIMFDAVTLKSIYEDELFPIHEKYPGNKR